MDYNEHDLKVYVPCSIFQLIGTTWTWTFNNGVPRQQKGAAAETARIYIPIQPPASGGEFGTKIKSVSVPLRITTSDLTGVITSNFFRSNYYIATNPPAVNQNSTAITDKTETGTQVTAAAQDRLYTCVVNNPTFDNNGTVTNASYNFELIIPCAAGTILYAYDATVTYSGID